MSGFTGYGHSDYSFVDTPDNKIPLDTFHTHPTNNEYSIHSNSMSTEQHAQIVMEEISNNTHSFVNETLNLSKKGIDLSAKTEIVEDNPIMNKYAKLANESYNHYENKPKVVSDFEKVAELNTNNNNVVMENASEVHMSLRGSMETKDWTDNNAKILSRHTFGDIEKTARYKEAEDQLLNVIDYAHRVGKKLTISGHSLGGGLSYDLANKYDIEGFHFQPAISMKQVLQQVNKTFKNNFHTQQIFKTHFDLPSLRIPQFHNVFKSSTDTMIHYIGTKPSLDNSLVKTHSVEHFTENATKVRNTPMGSMIKSLSLAGAVGLQGYFASQDIKNDQKTNNPITNSTIDTFKNVAELGAGLAIGSALAPELLVPAMISGAFFNIGMEHIAQEIKTTGVQDANVVKKAFVDGRDIHGNNIGNRIKGEFKDLGHSWAKTGKSIKHFFGF